VRCTRVAISIVVVVLAVSGGSASLRGQAVPGQRVAFEVASVRVVDTGVPPRRTITDYRVDLVSYPIREIILMAYEVEPYRLVMPDWIRDTHPRVDVQATMPAGATRKEVPVMLCTLLAERFGFVAHFESRPIDVCELTVAPGGVKMTQVPAADDRKTAYETPQRGPDSPPYDTMVGTEGQARMVLSPSGGLRLITADTNYEQKGTEHGTTRYDATGVMMAQLVDWLSASVGKPVIDKTGLTGLYQFQIELPRAQLNVAANQAFLARAGITNRNGEPITAAVDTTPASGSAFKAVQALGLKLDERRAPFEVLVVDKLEKAPTPN
jgi:uncharacterized protein (TIGR03435 family)